MNIFSNDNEDYDALDDNINTEFPGNCPQFTLKKSAKKRDLISNEHEPRLFKRNDCPSTSSSSVVSSSSLSSSVVSSSSSESLTSSSSELVSSSSSQLVSSESSTSSSSDDATSGISSTFSSVSESTLDSMLSDSSTRSDHPLLNPNQIWSPAPTYQVLQILHQ